MDINYQEPAAIRPPKRLFVPLNEFNFANFTVRPRYLGRTGTRQNRNRIVRLPRKGIQPCQRCSS